MFPRNKFQCPFLNVEKIALGMVKFGLLIFFGPGNPDEKFHPLLSLGRPRPLTSIEIKVPRAPLALPPMLLLLLMLLLLMMQMGFLTSGCCLIRLFPTNKRYWIESGFTKWGKMNSLEGNVFRVRP